MKKYKDTLLLPKTTFPIKGSSQAEEKRLATWKYEQPTQPLDFVLHSGPPYCSGAIHTGHILNATLKDIVVRHANLMGKNASLKLGRDCHGLPIEMEVKKDHKDSFGLELRQHCRDFAGHWAKVQQEQFERIGVLHDGVPYSTMSNHYEAQTVRELANFVKAGLLYKGSKPVFWCPNHLTALAISEIEYNTKHVSESICVALPLKDDANCRIVIWTTTPWTLEANVAVAVNADADYVMCNVDNGIKLIFAKQRMSFIAQHINRIFADSDVVLTCKGKDLVSMKYATPFGSDDGIVVVSDHVTMDSGTGCVHIAPAHGEDDFAVGKKYGLPIVNAIDDKGRNKDRLKVDETNKAVIAALQARGLLLFSEPFVHKYPYSDRSHKPVIMKTTAQWFINIDRPFNDGQSLRDRALAALTKVKWVPGYGFNRIKNMLESRPDWCLSRQRTWGVPIPVFYDGDKPIVDFDIMNAVADIYEKEGSDAWHKYDSDVLSNGKLPPGLRKEADILDVWFDSGVSSAAVMNGQQSDLYLEGSDQHRGWFQSSLLAALGSRELIPYKAVLTHGFVVDENGEKLSKSKKNYVDPFVVIKQDGAELLRLWVASTAFVEDVRTSKLIMDGVKQTYHKIRNTTRFMLAGLSDFDPYMNMVRTEDLSSLDRYMILLSQQLENKIKRAYESYDFCAIVKDVESFCYVDLSSFYFDVIKDTLYCDCANSIKRRSIQTALYRVSRSLIRMLSPILCFTMDEAWECLPKLNKDSDSVHGQNYSLPFIQADPGYDEMLIQKYTTLRDLRRVVNVKLEELRQNKEIGSSYEAEVDLKVPAEYWLYAKQPEEVRKILMVSKATIEFGELNVIAKHATGPQCQRCWSYCDDVGKHKHNDACQRCDEALTNVGYKEVTES